MDRSFIITGLTQADGATRPIAGVLFCNTPLDQRAISNLGFFDIQSMQEVKPLSKQPTEPTLYMFPRSPPAMAVDIIRLDWEGKETSRGRAPGEPCSLIPPVSGDAAESLLYGPRAYVISANVKECGRRSKPVVAVLFLKPAAGEICPGVDKKMLNRLGLVDLQTVERAQTTAKVDGSVLYVFERTPGANSVNVASVGKDGACGPLHEENGEPHTIIPPISGSAADRYVNPRGALSASDMPRPSAMPQSEPPAQSRRMRAKR